jgi:hypothetical protein
VRRVRTRRRSAGPAARIAAFAATIDPAAVSSEPAQAQAQAQAYCGPGHGRRWPVEPGDGPADVVRLQTTGVWSYRLLVHPRTQGPARDHQGRYPYLPIALAPDRRPW